MAKNIKYYNSVTHELDHKGIIKVLRHCGSHKGCYNCPRGKAAGDCMKILIYAADALEKYIKIENALKSLIADRNDPVSCNVDAILKGEEE